MRRAMQCFCRGERRTQHGKALAFSCILHSRRVQRHVRTVQAAFFCRTVHAASPKYPLKAQSHPAQGAREAALSFPFSQSRDISRRFQRAPSKIRVPKAFRSSGANTVYQAPFHTFRQTTANHTPRGCRTHRAESALSCGTKGTKTSRSRRAYKFLRPARKRFPCAAFHAQKGVHAPIRIVFRERRAVQF